MKRNWLGVRDFIRYSVVYGTKHDVSNKVLIFEDVGFIAQYTLYQAYRL